MTPEKRKGCFFVLRSVKSTFNKHFKVACAIIVDIFVRLNFSTCGPSRHFRAHTSYGSIFHLRQIFTYQRPCGKCAKICAARIFLHLKHYILQ